VIAREPQKPGKNAKTTIVFTLNNVPGSLFKALSVFALRSIDLSKIESRPLVGRPFEYLFYIDILTAMDDPVATRALHNLEEYAFNIRVLGSYTRHIEEQSAQ
jgi:prephenate dehydratase